MAAHQAPPSLGFSGQEHWGGLSFPSSMHESKWKWSAQSCLTLSDPKDCSLEGSYIHGIFQARVLEWGAFAFSLKRSLVFPILLFSSISLHWSLRKAFLSLLAILWNSKFKWVYLSSSPLLFASLLFTAICKAYSDSHFPFLHFFFLGMVLIPVLYNVTNLHP